MTFRFVDEKGLHSAEKISEKISTLARTLGPGASVIVIESERSLQTAVRFSACLSAGRIPFLLPAEEFRNQEFLSLVKTSLGEVALWPLSSVAPSSPVGTPNTALAKVSRGFIVKTSGTSGMRNKFVLHDPELFFKKFRKRAPTFERTLNFFPPDSIAGIELLLEATVHGRCIVNPGKVLDLACVAQLLVAENIDYFHVTPTFLNVLLFSGGLNRSHLSSVKFLAYGSEPAQRSVLEQVKALKPELELIQIYGMSEIGLQKTLPVTDIPEKFRLDEAVNPYRIFQGFLEVKSESPMVCYLNHERMVGEGWYATGDAVEEDNGALRVIGRADDVINVAGKKFHPIQLEELIMGMEGVDDVMVTTEPHELIGHAVIAQIATRMEERSFRAKLRDHLEKTVPPRCAHRKFF